MLRPLDGGAGMAVLGDTTLLVDRDPVNRLALSWWVYTDQTWRSVGELRPHHAIEGVATFVAAVNVDGGEVRFSMSAGVAQRSSVGVVEVTNASPHPLAVGVSADAGDVMATRVEGEVLWAGEQALVVSELAPKRSAPIQDAGWEPSLVVPLAHSATARFTVPLDRERSSAWTGSGVGGAGPTVDEIERGWSAHLARGMRTTVVGDERWTDRIDAVLRLILTAAPHQVRPDDVTATAGFGFALPTQHVVAAVERSDTTPAAIVTAVGTWGRLAHPTTGAAEEHSERILLAVAKAAHTIRRSVPPLVVPLGWGARPLVRLAQDLRRVGQPDVADSVEKIAAVSESALETTTLPTLAELQRWWGNLPNAMTWPGDDQPSPGWFLGALAQRFVDSRSVSSVSLLADLPKEWRGRAIDVFGAPLDGATLSFGIRWHGPRPALLWSIEENGAGGDAVIESTSRPGLHVPSIDPAWSSHELAGEVLLADPNWSED